MWYLLVVNPSETLLLEVEIIWEPQVHILGYNFHNNFNI